MASSYLNIVTFLLTTLFYYMAIKPSLTYDILTDTQKYKTYTSNSHVYLAVYFLLVIVTQFIINASIITTNCGGSITENMGAAGLLTFIPWTFIFGVIIAILIIYPGFKSAFSDVIGYYYVSSSATKVLTDLLIDKDVQKQMDKDTELTTEKKEALESAADAIIKICGNTSILINQIVPSNFVEYWNILTPLMKDKYRIGDNTDIRNNLFELVVTRDNIGEALWFMYTGLLLTSIVQLNITTRGCASNPKTMEQNYKKFIDNETVAKQKQEQATSSIYTIT
uniref:Uncharacterized protein n=1 Tax=viral metagenome TaxID=1070528 RepID=A0A6C0IDY6_9ZZZZ